MGDQASAVTAPVWPVRVAVVWPVVGSHTRAVPSWLVVARWVPSGDQVLTYLDDLLRTRERLAATIDGIDEWARADATPSTEEITRIRRLINRINGDIAGLDAVERAQIDDAVAVVRRHRAAHTVALGLPTLRAAASVPMTALSTAPEATA